MGVRLGQFCITVTDLARSEAFYADVLGLEVQQRIEIEEADEIVLGSPESDASIQLAQLKNQSGPIDHGSALWKHYLYTDNIEKTYSKAIDFGCESVMEPKALEQWPVTVAFIKDPDGYLIELIERRSAD